MTIRSSYFGIAAAAVLLLAAPHVARAQLRLDPAVPERALLGPHQAKGAVIWSHGRSAEGEDSTVPTPPYIVNLRDGGWDTFRFDRKHASDWLAPSALALTREVHRLKQQGYRQIVLAGQSFGGFLSLMAADSSDEVDAVIATAPAAYGSFSDYYGSWRNNATKLYPLLASVRQARIMMFYFHGDDFDPGGRAEQSRDILAERKLPYVVVDQPPHLTSHWAADTQQFATLFGGCILGFIDAPEIGQGARCQGDAFLAGGAGEGVAAATTDVAEAGGSRRPGADLTTEP